MALAGNFSALCSMSLVSCNLPKPLISSDPPCSATINAACFADTLLVVSQPVRAYWFLEAQKPICLAFLLPNYGLVQLCLCYLVHKEPRAQVTHYHSEMVEEAYKYICVC